MFAALSRNTKETLWRNSSNDR